MYEVTVKRTFSAAHTLNFGGKNEDLHGHNFTVEISVASNELNEEGLVIDFIILKNWTDEILDELDHKFINDLYYFKEVNPSSENIAKLIYDKITEKLMNKEINVTKVTVWESENSRATYTGER